MSKSGLVLAGLAIGLIVFVWAATSFTHKLTATPETFTVGEAFIEDIAAGDYDAATALAVSQLQTPEQKTQLEAFVGQHTDVLNENTEVHLTGRGIDNDLRYAYGTISSGETESPIYLEFMDENGETRVSYFSFNADDITAHNTSDSAE